MTDLVGSDLSVQLGARRVLAGASCALRAGELVLLAGRNGAVYRVCERRSCLQPQFVHAAIDGSDLRFAQLVHAIEIAHVLFESRLRFARNGAAFL